MTLVAAAPVRDRLSAPANEVLIRLAALRRRAIRVLALRYGLMTGAVSLVVTQAVTLGAGLNNRDALVVAGLSLAVALGAAASAALLRAPTLAATAATVDRRQGLECRATTALQFVQERDAVAALVVSDAAERLRGCLPAQVFPLEVPGRAAGMAAAVALASVFLGVSGPRESLPISVSGAARGGSAGPSQARSPGATFVVSPPQDSTASDAPSPGLAMEPGGERPDAATPAIDRAATGVTESGVPSPVDPTETAQSRDASAVRAASVPAGDSSQGGDTALPATLSPATAGALHTRALHARAGQAAGLGAQGGGLGQGPAGGSADGSGGVKDGSLAGEADGAPVPPRLPIDAASARHRVDAPVEQAAIVLNRVPPALRHYVRDYFRAIRTPQR